MLSARHIFRLCKQSAQYSACRTSRFFSSNSDDSDSKRPPKKGEGETESLDVLLNATYASKRLSIPKPKSTKPAPSKKTRAPIADVSSVKSSSPVRSVLSPSKDHSGVPIEKLLQDVYKGPKSQVSDAEPTTPSKINVAVPRRQDKVSSTELVNRIKKIAEEVAGAAGPKSREVAEDLLKKLDITSKSPETPLNLNELSFEKQSSGSSDQNLDLLRNRIVSEEQIYQITPGTWPSQRQRKSRSPTAMEFDGPWAQRALPQNVLHNLDVSLNPTKRIGIFESTSKENLKTKSCLPTYEKLEQRELHLLCSYAPQNWFEQCIQWTNEGKLWHFPINNEQGLNEGQEVSFTEHIFLEDHLEGWCPTFGPVRHFMELVCLGLSKNPYLSVEEKIENIMWYRDYFEQHRELLQAAGTLDSGITKVPALEAQ